MKTNKVSKEYLKVCTMGRANRALQSIFWLPTGDRQV